MLLCVADSIEAGATCLLLHSNLLVFNFDSLVSSSQTIRVLSGNHLFTGLVCSALSCS